MTLHAKPHSRLLSIQETAHELHVFTKTVRRLVDRGELSAHRIGRCLRVSTDALRIYLNRNRA